LSKHLHGKRPLGDIIIERSVLLKYVSLEKSCKNVNCIYVGQKRLL
jgi:hypothetical protein